MTAPNPVVEGFSLTHAAIMDGVSTWEESLYALYDEGLDIYGVSDSSLQPNTDSFDNEGDDSVLSRWTWLNYAEMTITSGYLSFPLMATITGRPYTISGVTAEVQTVTVTGVPTGGTFTLTYSGQTTAPIAYNATAATVRTALEALSNLNPGDITTSGGPLPGTPVTVSFVEGNVVQMTATGSFTGGTSPAVAVTTTTPGGDGAGTIFGADLWHEDDFNVSDKPVILQMPSKDNRGAARLLTLGLYRVNFGAMTLDGPRYKDGLKVNWNGTALKSAFDEKGVAFADGKKRVGRLLSSSLIDPNA
jgi:hypothetical protein